MRCMCLFSVQCLDCHQAAAAAAQLPSLFRSPELPKECSTTHYTTPAALCPAPPCSRRCMTPAAPQQPHTATATAPAALRWPCCPHCLCQLSHPHQHLLLLLFLLLLPLHLLPPLQLPPWPPPLPLLPLPPPLPPAPQKPPCHQAAAACTWPPQGGRHSEQAAAPPAAGRGGSQVAGQWRAAPPPSAAWPLQPPPRRPTWTRCAGGSLPGQPKDCGLLHTFFLPQLPS